MAEITNEPVTFGLVHGAWHGAWRWQDLERKSSMGNPVSFNYRGEPVSVGLKHGQTHLPITYFAKMIESLTPSGHDMQHDNGSMPRQLSCPAAIHYFYRDHNC